MQSIIKKYLKIDSREQILSFLGAFIAIGLIAFIQNIILEKDENILLIGSFGATSVLVYGAVKSPLAHTRNLFGGHILSAIVGVLVVKNCPDIIWITAPLAVALSIVTMQITNTLHPPGGATALIAVTGSPTIQALGFWYVLYPVFTGVVILFAVAWVFNKIRERK